MANTTSGSYTFEKNFAIDDIIAEAVSYTHLTLPTILRV